MYNNIFKNAFTLVELLVVIAIVGILSGLIIVGMNSSIQSATIAKAQIFSASLRDSLLMNLVSEWKFDDGSGSQTTTADSWNGSNNGTLVNFNFNTTDGWRSGSSCISGSCLQFDGTDDYVNCGNSASLSPGSNNFTIEVWFNSNKASTSNPNSGALISNKSTAYPYNAGYHITVDGYLYFTIGDGANYAQKASTILVNDGKWHLGTLTFNRSGSGIIYIDGILNTSQSITSVGSIIGGQNTTLGAGAGGGFHRYTGSMDTIRYYSEVIPTSQIKEQYYVGINKLFKSGGIDLVEYKGRIRELSFVK